LKELSDETIKVSLRSKGDFNVIKIAEKFGGGGHPNAAGFSSPFKQEKTIRVLTDLVRKIRETHRD
ncbi:MAG: DHHA1 domain-containing protein, partial [Candidatus Subteraquimicrobiales bacterium]|nr:DHHA1 domain-containing protein [Candidatus Subteraquimicrobiales bacterium]